MSASASASAPEPPPRTSSPDSVLNAYITSLRLLFTAWITHFRSLGYIKESSLDMLDRTVCRKAVELTVRDYKAREVIGGSEKIWTDLVELFRVASPSLEQRSYGPGDPLNPNADGPSSNVIVANHVTLLKDLQRLDNILSMARNVLTAGQKVQNLAAQVGFDREVCTMINLCVKITARGYDGDGTNVQEDKWQGVINGFKKLLITCLQFLSNLVTMNERLKLMLWAELFDSSSRPAPLDTSEPTSAAQDLARATDKWVLGATRAFAGNGELETEEIRPARTPNSKPKLPMTPYFLFVSENRAKIKAQLSLRTEPTSKQVMQEGTRRWNTMSEKDRQVWRQAYNDRLAKYRKDLEAWEAAGRPDLATGEGAKAAADAAAELEETKKQLEEQISQLQLAESPQVQSSTSETTPAYKSKVSRLTETAVPAEENSSRQLEASEADNSKRMMTAAEGMRRLSEGKNQLLKRLEAPLSQKAAAAHGLPSNTGLAAGDHIHENEQDSADEDEQGDEIDGEEEEDLEEEEDYEEEDESEVEESSDDEDFAIPGEDGRGLLTDVPLILGPNEIEVLPMIIMSGIVPPKDEQFVLDYPRALTQPIDAFTNLYIVRCHLLLAQENGRNLLRELLIFVAAWDLRDEELYFKFMVKIMEAILMVGLMPFAYVAFKESKDIISPAQAVIMKLLTKIFHFRQAFTDRAPIPVKSTEEGDTQQITGPQLQVTFDIQVVQTLFSEFRQHIIPQICALIFLQGRIRNGLAHLEDFPLNLWDMERMYEGVYQYLEFFAILTDHDRWKQMMADWEVTSELITLLRELDAAIPKGRMISLPPLSQVDRNNPLTSSSSPKPPGGEAVSPQSSEAATVNQHMTPVAVERPYDVNNNVPEPLNPSHPEHETPQVAGVSPYPEPIHDEPADFEWRNLKKLCVLVLSSLVWKNRRLQDQVRNFYGIQAILLCCSHDEHNPYIKEHAIMCLRFLLEGNKENQDVVRELAEESESTGIVVPPEVLDHHGYETFMDGKGQVGLRRKEVPGALKVLQGGEGVKDIWNAAASAAGQGIPEWMQMLMKRKADYPDRLNLI